MQRGVLTLNKEEFNQLISKLDINRFANTLLYEKLNSALENITDNIQIFLSEDEIEMILDEVGLPFSDDPVLNNALQKIRVLMTKFRS
jgi:uncharacterized protein (DUF1778 family)